MSEAIEVLITSDASSNMWSSCVWDIDTGTALHSYKGGGVSSPNTLSLINNDYIIAADRLKPVLHIWAINSQEELKGIRLVCPGRISTLAISPDGCYCAAGIEEKLYVWQLASGRLLSVTSKHFQNISKVLFTSDGTHIVSAGEDGLVLIWPLAHLISQQSNDLIAQSVAGETDPLHTISDHSLPVTDMFVGKCGLNARLVTVSADRTLKIYQLLSGDLLLSVVFEVCLTAVTMNLAETSVFVGAVDGDIFEFSLLNPPRNRDYHLEKPKAIILKGHSKQVTCLSVSVDGQSLASGSNDEQVIIWHIQSKQKIRSIPHKGAITNAFFAIAPTNMFVHNLKPTTVLNTFKRSVENDNDGVIEVIHSKNIQLPSLRCFEESRTSTQVHSDKELQKEIEKLKAVNAKLYNFSLNKILQTSEVSNGAESSTPQKLPLKMNKRKRKRNGK